MNRSLETERASLSVAVAHWADTQPTAIALRCGATTLTWSELDDAVTRFGAVLNDRGVRMGDRVVLLGENSLEWVIAFLGCQRAHVIVVPMNTRLAPSQIVAQVAKVSAKLVLHDAGLGGTDLGTLTGTPCVELTSLRHEIGNERLDLVAAVGHPEGSDVPALISFTSGTTGIPKGAVISSTAMAELAHAFSNHFETGPADSTLIVVPIFHNTGFADQLAHMVASGGTTSLLRRYRTGDAAAELMARPATFLAAVPSMLRMLMLHDEADAIFSGVRAIMYGGSAMPEAWVQELQRRWPHLKLVHAYGLSEFTSVCTFLPSHLAATKAESVGLPLPGVQLRIVDESGHDVAPGDLGEVWVSGPTRMLGYWDEPGLTSEKMTGQWLRTGDVGRIDGDGLLWLHGRADDVINRGGEKIMPTFVESHIARHETIAAACAFGYPDHILQHRVAAAVETRAGAAFDERELVGFLRTCLPDYAIPDRWVVYDALPLNASGKFDRRTLRADFEAALQPKSIEHEQEPAK
ncbi:class I adenylate-forming enzyme family protein [Mycolicibacterium sp. CBMA 226]|uniref:class I adenylate-forming enzyme family protein n=1 Tax=Mycolicibacterium sp. CBMA 226 TaxID=2606611 RepID=UPI0012DE9B19|nr:class I adenylate-forming enzyme family protein [Mycolicibacterium sp. CBMA 226]MUL79197.1 acyl--CoA ligase [Mycolicibacterium sp. CBMA 226]